MNFVKRAQSVALTSCCASSVGFERSTSVEVSMSIWRKPAGMASSIEALDRRDFLLGSVLHLLRVRLEVVALKEEGTLPLFADRRREHHGGVLGRTLLRVAHLAAGDLEDERADLELPGGAHGGPSGVVGHHPDVDRGDREAGHLAPAPRLVERENRGRQDAERFGRLTDGVPRGLARVGGSEDGRPDQGVDHVRPEARRVRHDEAAVETDGTRPGEGFAKLGRRRVEVHGGSHVRKCPGILMQRPMLRS